MGGDFGGASVLASRNILLTTLPRLVSLAPPTCAAPKILSPLNRNLLLNPDLPVTFNPWRLGG
jgi:hypothetical protein